MPIFGEEGGGSYGRSGSAVVVVIERLVDEGDALEGVLFCTRGGFSNGEVGKDEFKVFCKIEGGVEREIVFFDGFGMEDFIDDGVEAAVCGDEAEDLGFVRVVIIRGKWRISVEVKFAILADAMVAIGRDGEDGGVCFNGSD